MMKSWSWGNGKQTTDNRRQRITKSSSQGSVKRISREYPNTPSHINMDLGVYRKTVDRSVKSKKCEEISDYSRTEENRNFKIISKKNPRDYDDSNNTYVGSRDGIS